MNISEFSTALRELSDDYSSQRIVLDEYRLKRKHFLDEIDQTFNHQNYADISRAVEKSEESDNPVLEIINKVFDFDKKNDDSKK
ncbi:MAG: hypothetical protein GXP18_13300 [Gammaproteobacteria bacterium]|nr:hypothetical protein [Gammaproteobacteria bacterium]